MVPTTGFEPAMGLLRRITNPFHSTNSGKSALAEVTISVSYISYLIVYFVSLN